MMSHDVTFLNLVLKCSDKMSILPFLSHSGGMPTRKIAGEVEAMLNGGMGTLNFRMNSSLTEAIPVVRISINVIATPTLCMATTKEKTSSEIMMVRTNKVFVLRNFA